jgi:hypothetical protein
MAGPFVQMGMPQTMPRELSTPCGIVQALADIARMRQMGVLDDGEFKLAKSKILASPAGQ